MFGGGDLWALKWWSGQKAPDESVDALLDIVAAVPRPNVVRMWFNEGGVIDKAIKPLANRMMRERRTFVDLRPMPSMKDKRAKVSAFIARVNAGAIWLPDVNWAHEMIDQIATMSSGGKFDDKADVAGLIGRAIDQFRELRPATVVKKEGIKPFTGQWLEYDERLQMPAVRYR